MRITLVFFLLVFFASCQERKREDRSEKNEGIRSFHLSIEDRESIAKLRELDVTHIMVFQLVGDEHVSISISIPREGELPNFDNFFIQVTPYLKELKNIDLHIGCPYFEKKHFKSLVDFENIRRITLRPACPCNNDKEVLAIIKQKKWKQEHANGFGFRLKPFKVFDCLE